MYVFILEAQLQALEIPLKFPLTSFSYFQTHFEIITILMTVVCTSAYTLVRAAEPASDWKCKKMRDSIQQEN